MDFGSNFIKLAKGNCRAIVILIPIPIQIPSPTPDPSAILTVTAVDFL